MKVIGIVGLPGSGKGEFSEVAKKNNMPVVVMGDVIRAEVRKAGLPPVDESMGKISASLREKHGMAAIATVCIPVVENTKSDVVLIDGIRGDAEVDVFRQHFRDFHLISIKTSLDTRFSRLRERGRSDDITSVEALENRDKRESVWGLLEAMKMADLTVANEGTREEFHMAVQQILNSLTWGINED